MKKTTSLLMGVVMLALCMQDCSADSSQYIIPYISASDQRPSPARAAKDQRSKAEEWGLVDLPGIMDFQIEADDKHAYVLYAGRWYYMDRVSAELLVQSVARQSEGEIEPTLVPTIKPAKVSTAAPTEIPSAEPTVEPTEVFAAEPTAVPTVCPTSEPILVIKVVREGIAGTLRSDMPSTEEWARGEYAVFDFDVKRDEIREITFVNSLDAAPANAMDVSAENNGSIMAWIDGNHLYIGADGKIQANEDCNRLFAFYENLEYIDFGGNFVTDNVKNMAWMFYGCEALTHLDISDWDTSDVMYMGFMFNGCSRLKSLDLSNWDTGIVVDMAHMFQNCKALRSLDIGDWNTSNVADMTAMFAGCSALLELDLANWSTRNVVHMVDMFKDCSKLSEDDIANWFPGDRTGYFASAAQAPVIAGTLRSNTPTTDEWTYRVFNILNLGINRLSIDEITFVDTLAGAPDDAQDVSAEENGSVMAWVDGTHLYIGANGKIRANEDCRYQFAFYSNLKRINFDGNFITDDVKNMYYMFGKCSSLTELDISDWNTGNVVYMGLMFNGCSALTELGVSDWDTGNVVDMDSMFHNCESLERINLSNWNVSNVVDMGYMFRNCPALSDLDISDWDTSNVVDQEFMFEGCVSLPSMDGDE